MDEIEKPQFFIIAGPNGSGKSTTSKPLLKEGVYIIDPDKLAKSLVDDKTDKQKANILAMRQTARLVEQKIDNKESFSVETVLSTDKYHPFVDKAKSNGFDFNLVYVATADPKINKNRVKDRVELGGHDVPTDKIEARYYRSLKFMPEFYDKAKDVAILDNSGEEAELQLLKKDKEVTFIKDKPKKWVVEALGEKRTKAAIKSYLGHKSKTQSKDIER